MKSLLPVLFFLLWPAVIFAQITGQETENIVTFCKVWGFLKYHHPAIAKGKYDWDKEFIDKVKIIAHLRNKGEENDFYYNWILNLGKLKRSKKHPASNAILTNYDLSWLKDPGTFSNKVTNLLLLVQNNTRSRNHYVRRRFLGLAAASYIHEKPYRDSAYPSVEMRLLTLSRYWNIVNYFYPYKYLTDDNWENVIKEFVPRFINSDNIRAYHLALLALFAKLNDSHTGFNPQLYGYTYKIPPFNNKIIDGKIIILNAFNDSICRQHDIRYGDVILKINGSSIKSLIDYYSVYVSASNYASLCRQLAPLIIWGDIDSAVITYERDSHIFNKVIHTYPMNFVFRNFQHLKQQSPGASEIDSYKILDNNIAYVDLGRIRSKKGIKNILKNIEGTNAIILDIRNYPNDAVFRPVTNFFCTERKPFARFAKQYIKYPGALKSSKTVYCGKSKGRKYHGQVVVLTDESTISFAEYFTQALKTIPNVLLIGSHTAGADGSNTRFILPGNISTSFSNEGVYYPDGRETQRTGIIPDITVVPTIEGIRSRKDEVLEKAIEILNEK